MPTFKQFQRAGSGMQSLGNKLHQDLRNKVSNYAKLPVNKQAELLVSAFGTGGIKKVGGVKPVVGNQGSGSWCPGGDCNGGNMKAKQPAGDNRTSKYCPGCFNKWKASVLQKLKK